MLGFVLVSAAILQTLRQSRTNLVSGLVFLLGFVPIMLTNATRNLQKTGHPRQARRFKAHPIRLAAQIHSWE